MLLVPIKYSLLPGLPRTLLCALVREDNAQCAFGWRGVQATWMWRDRCRAAQPCESRGTRGGDGGQRVASVVAMLKRDNTPLRLETRTLLIVAIHACVGVLQVRFGVVVVRVCARTTYVAYEAINPWLFVK